jgi:hypothetical protein
MLPAAAASAATNDSSSSKQQQPQHLKQQTTVAAAASAAPKKAWLDCQCCQFKSPAPHPSHYSLYQQTATATTTTTQQQQQQHWKKPEYSIMVPHVANTPSECRLNHPRITTIM